MDDFILYPRRTGYGAALFDIDAKDHMRAMVVGRDSSLVIYELFANSSNVAEDEQRGSKDKLAGFSKSFYSILSVMSGYIETTRKTLDDGCIRYRSKMFVAKCVSVLEDEKRRVFRVSADPRGCLAASADSLGRVLLYDLHTESVVRIWKGLRDARLGWVYDSPATAGDSDDGTLLLIYAPQLGLVSLYKMRHGPCQRVIAVGLGHSLASMPSLRVSLAPQNSR